MQLKFKRSVSLIGAAVLSALTVLPAQAQEDGKLETVTVTATRRAQSVQDIPITVSTLGSEQIEKADISNPGAIALNTPGLSYAEFSPGQALFSMRGVGSADDGAGLDNSVAVFLDGVYIGRGAGVNFDAFDLERIEVLKGPQGALFGRNTIGGAISLTTKKPVPEFEAKAALTVGNEGILRVQGLVNGEITDGLSGKLVVNKREHDGFVRNTLLNKDVQDEDKLSLRAQLGWVRDNSSWLLSVDSMEDSTEDAGRFPFISPLSAVAESLGANQPHTTASPIEGFNDREQQGISLQGTFDFPKGKLISITGVRNVEADWEMPSVGAPLGGLDLANGSYGFDLVDSIDEDVDTISQELRWVSETDGDWSFVGGMFYFLEDTFRAEEFRLDSNTVTGPQTTFGNEYTSTENATSSFAIYGQTTWDISDRWTALLGGRYTDDSKDYEAVAVNCGMTEADRAAAGFPNFSRCDGVGGSVSIVAETFRVGASESWSNFSPMASLQFRPQDNLMVFGTVSTGFKSGGFAGTQGVESAATAPVDPENATNFELGVKSELLDNTLRLNATTFFTDYEDLQIVRFGPVPSSPFGTFLTTNVGSASIKGLEVDFNWLLSNNFTLSGNYAYLNTEAKDLVINGTDASGTALTQAPENSLNLIANYNMPLSSGGDIDYNLQFSSVSEQRRDFLSDDTVIESHQLIDARVGWTSANEKYQLALWGKNLGGEEYVSHSYIVGPGVIGIWGAPRTIGLTGTVKY